MIINDEAAPHRISIAVGSKRAADVELRAVWRDQCQSASCGAVWPRWWAAVVGECEACDTGEVPGADDSKTVASNIVGNPQYGTTTPASDPAASTLAYTVSQLLQGVRGQRASDFQTGKDPVEAVASEWDRILSVHRVDFPPSTGPVLPPAGPLPEFEELVEEDLMHRRVASSRIRGVKAEDRLISETAAAVKLETLRVDAEYALLSKQSMLEDVWQRLMGNEPTVVAGVLAITFRDDELATRPLEVSGNCVVLEIIAPSLERAIPKKKPGTNRKGAPIVKRASATDRRDAYRQYVLGAALLAAREVVTVAPGIAFVDVSVLTMESKAAAVAGGTPRGLARFFLARSSVANANLSLPADEVVVSSAHASRISLGRKAGLKSVSLEYEKKDKRALSELLDPDASDQTVRERLGQLTASTFSKSSAIATTRVKRAVEHSSALVDSVRQRVSRNSDDQPSS